MQQVPPGRENKDKSRDKPLAHAGELVLTIENVLKHGKGALVSAKSIAAKSAIDFGLAYLLMHLMNKLRISQTIEKVLPSQQAALLKAIIIGKIITRAANRAFTTGLGATKIFVHNLGSTSGTQKLTICTVHWDKLARCSKK